MYLEQNITSIENSNQELIDFFTTLNEDHSTLSNGGWTVAQCLEHISYTERNALIINTKAPSTDREYHEEPFIAGADKLHYILFEKRERKVVAPEIVSPKTENNHHPLKHWIDLIINTRSKLLEVLKNQAERDNFPIYPHPRLGNLTDLDWVYFTISHTKRHIQQIKDIIG
jgi:hypothetical protein